MDAHQGCGPCPSRYDSGSDETRLHALNVLVRLRTSSSTPFQPSGCATELLRVLRREPCVSSLNGGQQDHKGTKEQADP